MLFRGNQQYWEGRHRAALFFALLGSAGLLGCAPAGSPHSLDDYAQRLERTLDQPSVSTRPAPPPIWPRPRELGQLPQDIRLSSAQTLTLLDCGMTNRLAERNSTLARVQAASQRLAPEWAGIVELRACLDEAESAQAPDITTLLQRKLANWPRFVFQASLGSREMRDFLSYQRLRRSYPQAGRQALEQLREAMSDALAGSPPTAPALEKILHTLAESQGGGAILAQQAELVAGLERSNAALRHFLAAQPLCLPGLKPKRAEVMQAIFRKFYLGRVQPLWSELSRTKTAMNAEFAALFGLLEPVLDAAAQEYYRAYWQPGNAWDQRLSEVASEHVRLWQKALRQCGMLPGQKSQDASPPPSISPSS